MGCNCSGSNSAKFEYLVTLPDGTSQVVGSKPEARLLVASAKGGSYKAQLKK